jgi:hypothetical protein
MKTMNLEQFCIDLTPKDCSKNSGKIQDSIRSFIELNSTCSNNVARLGVLMGESIYERREQKSTIDRYANGLAENFSQRKVLLSEMRKCIDDMEKEIVFQEEDLGSYMEEFKRVKNPE